MQEWAVQAGIPKFTVMGMGAVSAEDSRVSQGIWLLIEKRAQLVLDAH